MVQGTMDSRAAEEEAQTVMAMASKGAAVMELVGHLSGNIQCNRLVSAVIVCSKTTRAWENTPVSSTGTARVPCEPPLTNVNV